VIGTLDRTITVYDPEVITGNAPPTPATSWIPWVVAALVLAGLWYFSEEERKRDSAGPLGKGAP